MKGYLRVWQSFEIDNVKKSLFVIGELKGVCFNCHNTGITLGEKVCPFCKTGFEFVAFRRKVNNSVINRFKSKYPSATFIDFDDFKKSVERERARKILDI